jgi:FAD/FMN-containing dehydrogenase
MRLNSRWGVTNTLDRMRGGHRESVIQDVDIPLDRAAAFLDFFEREIGIAPIWICPARAGARAGAFALFPMKPAELYVNFGFWDVLRRRERHPAGHFNRMIERKVVELNGIKSLYSESFFSEDEFDRLYGGEAYRALKAKYDPRGTLPDLYAKCVLRA